MSSEAVEGLHCHPLQNGRGPPESFCTCRGGQGPSEASSSFWLGSSIPGQGGLRGALIYGPPLGARIWPFSKCVINQIKSAGGQQDDQLPESPGSCLRAEHTDRRGATSSLCDPEGWLGAGPASRRACQPHRPLWKWGLQLCERRTGGPVLQISVKSRRAGRWREGPV